MAEIEFETLLTTDMRDTGGRVLKVLTVTAISGPYTQGGVEITPEALGLRSIDYLGIQGLFSIPSAGSPTAEDYDSGPYAKVVDLLTTKVDSDLSGDPVWKMIVFLYAMDGAELPNGIEMEFHPELPVTAVAIGSNGGRRNN